MPVSILEFMSVLMIPQRPLDLQNSGYLYLRPLTQPKTWYSIRSQWVYTPLIVTDNRKAKMTQWHREQQYKPSNASEDTEESRS